MTLEILTADALAPLRHGFFTRRGGASSGVFSGLNCGRGSSDQTEVVAINRARAARAMGVAPDNLISLRQVHSPDVVLVDRSFDGAPPEADAMVSATPGLALGILTADCQPVLFADHKARVIGAAHAGWRGLVDGVFEATVEAMESLGAHHRHIVAVIGPTISRDAYEVGPEMRSTVVGADEEASRFFTRGRRGDRLQFDLPGYGLHRLRRIGLYGAEWTHHCTYSDPSRFYSYRRSVHAKEADYGRLVSAIRL